MIERPILADRGIGAPELIARLLTERTGQEIAPSRAWRLETTLKPLMRERGFEDLDALVTALVTARDGLLGDRVVDALLNQESSFFRDTPVFDLIGDALSALRGTRRLRIWSAGCSTGQEALSLAMLLSERGLDEAEIVATDVSPGAISRARGGRYSNFEIQRGLSVRRMIAWFDGEGADWIARGELLRRIHYRQHNLVADAPPAGAFDVVLCRNVLLYLTAERRAAAFAAFARALRPGGLLVLGASETVIGQTDAFATSSRWRGLYERVDPLKSAGVRSIT